MWQAGYVSPHVHYFTPTTIKRAALRHGFRQVAEGGLKAITLKGLGTRIKHTEDLGVVGGAVGYGSGLAYLCVAPFLPKDTTFHLFVADTR
jgi:hypothetical protein